jgi:hypothetical protein
MDLPRLAFLNKYWADYPPLHIMVAAYLGIGPTAKTKEQDFAEVMAIFPEASEVLTPSGSPFGDLETTLSTKSESSQYER